MPAVTGKRRRAEKAASVAASASSKSMSNAAAADGAAAAPSSKRASASAELSRPKATPVDAASLDLDAFLNGGFMSVVPTPQGKGGIASTEEDAGDGDANADGSKPRQRRAKATAASKHRAELEALKTRDPEFFKYLQQADAELLDFAGDVNDEEEEEEEEEGSDDEDEDDDASSSDDEDEEETEPASPSASSSDEDEDEAAAIAPSSPTPASTQRRQKSNKRAVVPSQILRWCSEAKETLSLRAFKYLLQAYRAACHHGEGSADAVGKRKKQKHKKKKSRGSDSEEEESDFEDNSDADDDAAASAALASGAASNALLLFVLREADGIFRRLLSMPPADESGGKKKPEAQTTNLDPRSSPKWKKVEPLARSYLGNSLHLLTSAADPGMEAFVLRRLRPSAFLLVCSERLQRKTMKAALSVFGAEVSSSSSSGGSNNSNSASAAPLQAALFVREAAAALPASSDAFDAALKGAYRAFVKAAKFVTPASAPRLALMSACVVDLYASAPPAAAYAAAFGYVRQLAQLVRGALDAKAKEGYRTVYCWQTVSCLELWARLLAALLRAASGGGGLSGGSGNVDDDDEADENENLHVLEPLSFPVIQLLLTSASLVPSLRYAPLHLRLLKAAADLGAASGRFVPVTAPLLDLLDNVAAAAEATAARGGSSKKKGGSSSNGAPQRHGSSFSTSSDAFLLRASKVSVASATWQADIAERACEALASAAAAAPWPTHPAFPEIAAPTIARLRSFSKNCGCRGGAGDRCRSASKGLVAAMEANVSWVGKRRAAASLAPADDAGIAAFVASATQSSPPPPLRAYADLLAQKARDKREMATAAAMKYGGGAAAADGGGEFGDEEDDGEKKKKEKKELAATDEKVELAGNRRDRRAAVQRDGDDDDDDEEEDSDDDEDESEEDESDDEEARYGEESGSEDEVVKGSSSSDDDDNNEDENRNAKRSRRHLEAEDDDDDEEEEDGGLRDYNPSDSD